MWADEAVCCSCRPISVRDGILPGRGLRKGGGVGVVMSIFIVQVNITLNDSHMGLNHNEDP